MRGEIAIQNILSTDAGYSAITTSIFYDEIEQNQTLPLCVLKVDEIEPNDTMDGVSTLDFDYVYLTHMASTKKQVDQLATLARTALDRKTGTYNGVNVVSIQFRTQRSDSEFLVDKKVFTMEQYYKIMTGN